MKDCVVSFSAQILDHGLLSLSVRGWCFSGTGHSSPHLLCTVRGWCFYGTDHPSPHLPVCTVRGWCFSGTDHPSPHVPVCNVRGWFFSGTDHPSPHLPVCTVRGWCFSGTYHPSPHFPAVAEWYGIRHESRSWDLTPFSMNKSNHLKMDVVFMSAGICLSNALLCLFLIRH